MSAVNKEKPDLLNDLISEEEFCKKLGIGKTSAWSLRDKGKISFYRIMGHVYYSQEQINEYLRKCENRAGRLKLQEKD